MDWVAKGKINLAWQIVFSFLPGVLIWSFFRIKKLRVFLLTMGGPAVATVSILPLVFVGSDYYEVCPNALSIIPEYSCMNESLFISSIIVNVIYHSFKTYFIIRWTREWNKQFEIPV